MISNNQKQKSYSDLSEREKRAIIRKAAKASNQAQRDLVKRYDSQYGSGA